MPLPIAHDLALRWTRIAWVFVVAASVLAIGVPLLPSPESPVIDLTPPDPGSGDLQAAGGPDSPAWEDVAWTDLVAVMTEIHAVERAEQTADASEDPQSPAGGAGAGETGQPGDAVEQQGLPGWRYVGDVELAGRLVAVLSIGGAQVFLDEGAEVQGFTVAEVTPEFIIAEGRNGRFRVQREQSAEAPLRSAPRSGMRVPPQAADANRAREQRLRAIEEARENR